MKNFGPKIGAGHTAVKGHFQEIRKVFWAKFFCTGSQDMGLQLCQLGRSMRRSPSRRFGPPKTEKLIGQNQYFMCIMGIYLLMIVLEQVGALRVVVYFFPSWLLVLVMAHETKHRIFIGWGFAYCGCVFVWLFYIWLYVKRKLFSKKHKTKHKPI